MFTLAGDPYPLVRVEAAAAYPHGSAYCDGCASRIPYLSHCYHSAKVFGSQRGGFDLCEECHANVQFREPTACGRKPLPEINTRVKLVGLVNSSHLNDAAGTVVRHADSPQRVGVRIDTGGSIVSVHVDNLLIERHFFIVDDDALRILAPPSARVKVDGQLREERVIPIDDLEQDVPDHSIEINQQTYRFKTESCAICFRNQDALRRFSGHPVLVCDACDLAIRSQPCPFCRATTGEHAAQPTMLKFLKLPLASRDVRLFAKMASLCPRYQMISSATQLEIQAKYMEFEDEMPSEPVYRGGGATRSLGDACAAAVTGNGSSVVLRPPAGWTIDVHKTYADEMRFDDVVAFDSILYRLGDSDDVHKSSDFVDGRRALERARFSPVEKRVAIVVSVFDAAGTVQYIYVFFSVNPRMPGVVVLMPDPDGQTAAQCVSLVDFYDPKFWRSRHSAVNHNDLGSYTRTYAKR